jgi:NAD(P)-dependent dehydrogenase (short-subunit alcohol dehydrogenase family)
MSTSAFDLTGRTAIVTGGSRGIGRAICMILSQLGADIVVVGRDKTAIDETAEAVSVKGRRSLAIKTDVCVREQVERMVAKTVETFGKVDILVNNAGGVTSDQMVPALDMSDVIWDQVVNVNLRSVFICSQIAGRVMAKQQKGNIVNISSISGVHPYPMCIAYGASKAAVNNLTGSFAFILGPYNIRVNAVVAGPIMAGVGLQIPKLNPELYEKRIKAMPLGRIGTPEDIGWAVAYLTSDISSFVTGELLEVDGGSPKSPSLGTI